MAKKQRQHEKLLSKYTITIIYIILAKINQKSFKIYTRSTLINKFSHT